MSTHTRNNKYKVTESGGDRNGRRDEGTTRHKREKKYRTALGSCSGGGGGGGGGRSGGNEGVTACCVADPRIGEENGDAEATPAFDAPAEAGAAAPAPAAGGCDGVAAVPPAASAAAAEAAAEARFCSDGAGCAASASTALQAPAGVIICHTRLSLGSARTPSGVSPQSRSACAAAGS